MDSIQTIRNLARRGTLSHAWLLTGAAAPSAPAVQLLVQALLCSAQGGERPCGGCSHCRKLRKGVHPDLITVLRAADKRELTVDQIRAMRQDAGILPNEAARKVYLLPDADAMNQNAQNALLKLLEEPPPYAAFLLLGRNPGSFLPTVRSRCVELRLTEAEASPAEEPQQVAALADAFIAGDRLAFLRESFRAEKLDRQGFDSLLEALFAAAALRARADRSGRALLLAEKTEALREMRRVNVSPAHSLGWLLSFLS